MVINQLIIRNIIVLFCQFNKNSTTFSKCKVLKTPFFPRFSTLRIFRLFFFLCDSEPLLSFKILLGQNKEFKYVTLGFRELQWTSIRYVIISNNDNIY